MEKHRYRNQCQRPRQPSLYQTTHTQTIAFFHPFVDDRSPVPHAWHSSLIAILSKIANGPCYFRWLAELNVSAKQVQARKARSTNLWPFAKTLILRANSILVCFVDKGLPTPKVEENIHHKQLVLWCELGKEREPSKGSVLFKKLK